MIILQIFLWILFALFVLVTVALFVKLSVRLVYGKENAVILGLGIVKINLTKLRRRRENKKRKPKIQRLKKSLPPELPSRVNKESKPLTPNNIQRTVQEIPKQEKTSDAENKNVGKMLGDFVKGKKISENLTLLKQILTETAQKFSKYASLKVKKLQVTISCPDAAETAVLFGIANGVVCSIVGTVESFRVFSIEKHAVGVYQDYLSGKSTFEVDIVFSMRVFHLILCALPSLKMIMTKGKNPHQRSKNK